jgi:pimeloyl-ACP methyl ester carboxylesterase
MFFSYKGGRIHYTDTGSGAPVVLLHGYLESAEIWNGFAEKLSRLFRVISVDLPGCGLSDVYAETHSMEFMASAVKDLTDSLCLP